MGSTWRRKHELIQQKIFNTTFLDSPYPSEVTLMMSGDIASSLSNLQEVGEQPASTSPQSPGPPHNLMSLSQGSPSRSQPKAAKRHGFIRPAGHGVVFVH